MKYEKDLASTLNKLRDEAYSIAKEKGFHDEERPDYHWLMLVICEIAEAVEADRRGRHADLGMFAELKTYKGFREAYDFVVKDSVEGELADVCIRILDFMGMKGLSYDAAQKEDESFGFGGSFEGMHCGNVPKFCMYLLRNVYLAENASAFIAGGNEMQEQTLTHTLDAILFYCERRRVDILRHIRLKLEYNRTRPRMHGKEY